jgi:hypothetical protein
MKEFKDYDGDNIQIDQVAYIMNDSGGMPSSVDSCSLSVHHYIFNYMCFSIVNTQMD